LERSEGRKGFCWTREGKKRRRLRKILALFSRAGSGEEEGNDVARGGKGSKLSIKSIRKKKRNLPLGEEEGGVSGAGETTLGGAMHKKRSVFRRGAQKTADFPDAGRKKSNLRKKKGRRNYFSCRAP